MTAAPAQAGRVPDTATLSATLGGTYVLPPPGDYDGAGTFTAQLDRKALQLCYKLEVQDIEPATAAHIHNADSVETDVIVLTLDPPSSGSSERCAKITARLAKHLAMFPQYYYVDVHNADFPGGAIRGQIK